MYGDAIGAGPAVGTFDLWQRPDAVLAGLAQEGDPIPTGWAPLDKYLRGGGVRPGRVMVFGGPPFTGKTTIVAGMALHMSQKIHAFCLFADEGRAPAAARMAVMLGVSLEDVERDPKEASMRVGERLGERTIELLKPDRDECSLDAVVAYAEEKTPKGDTALIVLDSAQTIRVSADGSRDTDRVAKIERFMGACRHHADRTRFIIAATSWAPRAAYRFKRKDQNTERLAGFHGGAAIEYGADVAVFLDTTAKRRVSEMDIVKNRLAPLAGVEFSPVHVAYDLGSGQMLEVDRPSEDQAKEEAKAAAHEKTVSRIGDAILTRLQKVDGLTGNQVRELVRGKHDDIRAALLGLEARKEIESVPGGRGGGLIWRVKKGSGP